MRKLIYKGQIVYYSYEHSPCLEDCYFYYSTDSLGIDAILDEEAIHELDTILEDELINTYDEERYYYD